MPQAAAIAVPGLTARQLPEVPSKERWLREEPVPGAGEEGAFLQWVG